EVKGIVQRVIQLGFVLAVAAAVGFAVQPAKSAASRKSAAKKTSAKKKYVSSGGKTSAKTSSAKKSSAKTPAGSTPSARKAPARTSRPAPVSARVRAEAHDFVLQTVADRADLPVENAAALVPFFEQLYRHQRGEIEGAVHILHYGDSHTAADEWTGDLRSRFQERFGDGGSGFSLAGRPWNSYRRMDVRSGSTRGWHTDGLVGRAGDGVYGLGGVSMSAASAHELCIWTRTPRNSSCSTTSSPAAEWFRSTITACRRNRFRQTASPAPPIIICRRSLECIGWRRRRSTGGRCACSAG